MPIESSHPCHDCISTTTGNRAPCCHDNMLRLSMSEYNRDFKNRPNVSLQRLDNDYWMGEGVVISQEGPCSHLDRETGLCGIHDHKPLACRDAEAKKHPLCCKAPGGRQ